MALDDQALQGAPGNAPATESIAAELRDVVERLTAEEGLSSARARQLRWVAGELERSLPFTEMRGVRSLADLLARCDMYLALAHQGRLRRRAPQTAMEPESSKSSMRARRDCLLLLGRVIGIEIQITFPLPRADSAWHSPSARELSINYWRYRYGANKISGVELRTLAIAFVVADTGAHTSELCVMQLSDVSPDLRSIRVFRNPYFSPNSDPEVPEHLWLSEAGRTIMHGWLQRRKYYGGPEKSLWITLRQSTSKKADGRRELRPVGSPLGPRAITEAHKNYAARFGSEWPARLETVRRAAIPRPVSPWGRTV